MNYKKLISFIVLLGFIFTTLSQNYLFAFSHHNKKYLLRVPSMAMTNDSNAPEKNVDRVSSTKKQGFYLVPFLGGLLRSCLKGVSNKKTEVSIVNGANENIPKFLSSLMESILKSSQRVAKEFLEKEGFTVFSKDTAINFSRKTENLAKQSTSILMINRLSGEFNTSNFSFGKVKGITKSDYENYTNPSLPMVECGLYEYITTDSEEESLWWGNIIPIMGGEIYHDDGRPLSDEELEATPLRKVKNREGRHIKIKAFASGKRVVSIPGPWIVPYLKNGDEEIILKNLEDISQLAGRKVTRSELSSVLKKLVADGKLKIKLASDLQFKGVGCHDLDADIIGLPYELRPLIGKDGYIPGVRYDRNFNPDIQLYNGGIGACNEGEASSEELEDGGRKNGARFLADTVMTRKIFDEKNF